MKNVYNKTQLSPDTTFERHVFHRDQFAHYLRWTHVLKIAQIGSKILDIGCGTGNLLEVLYRNRYKASKYVGTDVRKSTIQICQEKWSKIPWAEFKILDWCDNVLIEDWDIVCCFEVLEHVGKENAELIIQNIARSICEKTTILISTPCYDEKVGAANNHIIDGKIGEFTYLEMRGLLENNFSIEKVWGTFTSQKDYKCLLNDWQQKYFDAVSEYFDSNILSNLMAPLFPEHSRNCLWKLKKKEE